MLRASLSLTRHMSTEGKRHYLLFYTYVPDIMEKRHLYREKHLSNVRESHKRGDIMQAGATINPVDGAVVIFNVKSEEVVKDFVKEDPYVQNGLVTSWKIREWGTVL